MQSRARSYSTVEDAIRYSYRLLSFRSRSEKELTERLQQKGFPGAVIENALRRLKEHGFIDDAALAQSLKRIAEEAKLLGHEGVKQFLRKRGLSENLIKETLVSSEIRTEEDLDEVNRAKKLLAKKNRTIGKQPEAVIRRKLWSLLMRKGYSFDTIKKALKKYTAGEEEE